MGMRRVGCAPGVRVARRAVTLVGSAAVALVVSVAGTPASAEAAGCSKSDFETVVDDAAGALRELNHKNKPAFQDKLRQLKDKRGWTTDQFLKEAAPFVRDDQIAVYDQKSDELLTSISTMGEEGSAAKAPDCALLVELRARMKLLVDTQTAKWAYMFDKIGKELAK